MAWLSGESGYPALPCAWPSWRLPPPLVQTEQTHHLEPPARQRAVGRSWIIATASCANSSLRATCKTACCGQVIHHCHCLLCKLVAWSHLQDSMWWAGLTSLQTQGLPLPAECARKGVHNCCCICLTVNDMTTFDFAHQPEHCARTVCRAVSCSNSSETGIHQWVLSQSQLDGTV